EEYGGVFLEEVRDFGLTLVPVVIPFAFCWMLYNQNSNEWSNQYYLMNGAIFGGTNPDKSYVQSAQFSIINTIFIIIMVEEAFLKTGRDIAKAEEYDGFYCDGCYSGLWQLPQWFVLTLGEALCSPTGVQFTYIEAGRQFRAVSTSFWLLSTSLGSILIMIFEPIFVEKGMSSGTKGWWYSGIGLFGFFLYCIASYFYTPRKQRPSINEAARLAKEAEFAMTKY
ncbi:hypothetical protein BGZ92_010253, partial [Podila epicladia]